jgi:hypothetical protein
MPLNQTAIQEAILRLQGLLSAKRRTYNKAIREDMEFTELKTLFLEINELEKQLDLCLKSNLQNDND